MRMRSDEFLNEEFHSLYQFFRVFNYKRLIWIRYVAKMEILTGKRTGKRPPGELKRRYEDNISMYLTEFDSNRGM